MIVYSILPLTSYIKLTMFGVFFMKVRYESYMTEKEKSEKYDAQDQLTIQSEQDSTNEPDRFTKLMFGRRVTNSSASITDKQSPPNHSIDYMQLLQQVDDIMGSIDRLKPIIKDFSPLLDFFRKSK